MIVLGGGFIGCEIASMAAMLGVKVTIVELLADILMLLDADLRSEVRAHMEKVLGIRVLTGKPLGDIAADSNGVSGRCGDETLRAAFSEDRDVHTTVAAQIFKVPEPDWIVVPFGTGGTAAGLLAGVAMTGLGSKVLGVSVVKIAGRTWVAHRIAGRILRLADSRRRVGASKLVVTTQWLGGGYGKQALDGVMATEGAQSFDLPLDPSYTAKAFAGAWAARFLADSIGASSRLKVVLSMPPVGSGTKLLRRVSAVCSAASAACVTG